MDNWTERMRENRKKRPKIYDQSSLQLNILMQTAESAKEQNPEKTLAILNSAERIDPVSFRVFELKTLCYLHLGRNEEAITAARKCVQIVKNNRSYGLLTQALLANGRTEEAIELTPQSVRMDGKVEIKIVLAEALRRQQRYAEAVQVLKLVKSDSYPKLLCQAFCLMHLKLFNESFHAFRTADNMLAYWPELESGDPRVRLYCGYLFLFQNTRKGSHLAMANSLRHKCAQAAKYLRLIIPDCLIDYQRSDYYAALKIAESHAL